MCHCAPSTEYLCRWCARRTTAGPAATESARLHMRSIHGLTSLLVLQTRTRQQHRHVHESICGPLSQSSAHFPTVQRRKQLVQCTSGRACRPPNVIPTDPRCTSCATHSDGHLLLLVPVFRIHHRHTLCAPCMCGHWSVLVLQFGAHHAHMLSSLCIDD